MKSSGLRISTPTGVMGLSEFFLSSFYGFNNSAPPESVVQSQMRIRCKSGPRGPPKQWQSVLVEYEGDHVTTAHAAQAAQSSRLKHTYKKILIV